jgi:hypothetical protein
MLRSMTDEEDLNDQFSDMLDLSGEIDMDLLTEAENKMAAKKEKELLRTQDDSFETIDDQVTICPVCLEVAKLIKCPACVSGVCFDCAPHLRNDTCPACRKPMKLPGSVKQKIYEHQQEDKEEKERENLRVARLMGLAMNAPHMPRFFAD